MPTKVFKVDYSRYTLVQNTLLGSDMLVGGCYMGPKIGHFKLPFYPLCHDPICMPPPAAHIEAHEPKSSPSTDVYAQYSLLKHLVGLK